MGASWGGEPPMVVGVATTLEEAAVCLGLWTISPMKIFEKRLKKAWSFIVQESSRALFSDAGLIGRDEQSIELNVERPGFFIDNFKGRDTRRISRAKSGQDTRSNSDWESRFNNRLKIASQLHLGNAFQQGLPPSLKFASALVQCNSHIYIQWGPRSLTYKEYVPALQSVQ